MKTIKQIWDETAQGDAIKDDAYQYLCNWLEEKKIPLTISSLADNIQGLWDMNCEQALDAINNWMKEGIRRNPDFINDMNEQVRKQFWGN